jgi:zinc protease
VVGDFESTAMEAKLRAALGAIPKGEQIPTPVFHSADSRPGVYFANKSDVNQSTILIAGLGIQRDNPDYYAADVMNDIFSGGFSSRLVQTVRTKLGLAYEAQGALTASYDHPGIFYVIVGTRSPATVPATQAALTEVRGMRTTPPSPKELQQAKDDLLNSFIFSYDSKDKILGEQVILELYHYPSDLLERYPPNIEKVTGADVTRVANKYIDVNKLAVVVVGNKAEIDPALSTLGPVTNLDIAIPPPPSGSTKPGPQAPPSR